MTFSVVGLLAIDKQPTEYIANGSVSALLSKTLARAAICPCQIPCNTGATGASPEGSARDGPVAYAQSWITTRIGVEPPPKRSKIIFGATMPKLMARIIAIAVMASPMVARRRSKFAFE